MIETHELMGPGVIEPTISVRTRAGARSRGLVAQAPVIWPVPLCSRTATRSDSLRARRLRPSNWAPCSIANDIWWMSPSTCDDAWRATVWPQMTPETVPRTTTCRPATIPVTFFTNNHLGGLYVTFDLAINLQNAAADDLQPLANDLKVVPYDRFLAA